MRHATTRTCVRALVLAALCFAVPVAHGAEEDQLAPVLRGALVKVYATTQGYDLDSPWNEDDPESSWQRGIVVRPGLVLTPSRGLAFQRMVEVSVANSARRHPASVAHADQEAGLALVRIEDEDLRAGTAPLPLGEPITIDDVFDVWQLGDSDLLERNTGTVQQVSLAGVQLQLTAKTNLTDAGNGQAALRDGRLVGMVVQTSSRSQEARVVAVETIRHYLEDVDGGDYRGFGDGGIFARDLLREDQRAYFQVPPDAHGLGVVRVNPGRTGYGVLQEGDVLTTVAGHALDDEGMFVDPLHGRLHAWWLLRGTTHPGDEVAATVLRGGVPHDVRIPIRDYPREAQRVPQGVDESRPPYLVVGGLVILELTARSRARSYLLSRYQERAQWDPPEARRRIVYASRVLADESNKGMDTVQAAPVLAVNGRPIREFTDVAAALASPQGAFHVVTFEGLEAPFVIPVAEREAIDARIAARYRIPALSNP